MTSRPQPGVTTGPVVFRGLVAESSRFLICTRGLFGGQAHRFDCCRNSLSAMLRRPRHAALSGRPLSLLSFEVEFARKPRAEQRQDNPDERPYPLRRKQSPSPEGGTISSSGAREGGGGGGPAIAVRAQAEALSPRGTSGCIEPVDSSRRSRTHGSGCGGGAGGRATDSDAAPPSGRERSLEPFTSTFAAGPARLRAE